MSSDILAKIMASVNANANVKIQISEKDGKLTIEISSASENKQFDDDPPTEIDNYGTKLWKDKSGKLHRDGDLPAIIWDDGRHDHYKHGNLHRDGDKPAIYYSNGESPFVAYVKNNKRHRDGNKPAIIREDHYEYWVNGKRILTVKHKNGVVEV